MFDLDAKSQELERLDSIMSKPEFWDKPQDEVSSISQERSNLKELIERWEGLNRETEDLSMLIEMAFEENDEASLTEFRKEIPALEKRIKGLDLQSLLNEPDDKRNSIVSINAGAGGTESQDWVEMLYRMYLRWSESKGYKIEVIDYMPGDEAGIKSVTFSVSSPYAYGFMKAEHGVHRMVRISPFDSTGRRHTTFASVSAIPEVDTGIEFNIDEKELRIDAFRSSGPGGQHVNKTSSAIRITHLPTNIVVQCQNEKSQRRNKEMAMMVLKARLYDLEKGKQDKKKQEMHQNQKDIAWGSQIRSYVFNPYRMVKDHRTNEEAGSLEKVMGGDIDNFFDAYLRMKH
ncbi:MAG: peptide chain release factor 2 [Deltaproteobacteria bacterium]|nr:peptide chain release factor 2 [Deltaproteobacteria bacterium]